MCALLRLMRLLIVAAATITAGTLPACGSMGMKYFVDPTALASDPADA